MAIGSQNHSVWQKVDFWEANQTRQYRIFAVVALNYEFLRTPHLSILKLSYREKDRQAGQSQGREPGTLPLIIVSQSYSGSD